MANEKDILVLSDQYGEYEALYIDGKLISQASSLGEGDAFGFWGEMTKKYNFEMGDIRKLEASDEDNRNLMDCGFFPDSLSDLSGNYSPIAA